MEHSQQIKIILKIMSRKILLEKVRREQSIEAPLDLSVRPAAAVSPDDSVSLLVPFRS